MLSYHFLRILLDKCISLFSFFISKKETVERKIIIPFFSIEHDRLGMSCPLYYDFAPPFEEMGELFLSSWDLLPKRFLLDRLIHEQIVLVQKYSSQNDKWPFPPVSVIQNVPVYWEQEDPPARSEEPGQNSLVIPKRPLAQRSQPTFPEGTVDHRANRW